MPETPPAPTPEDPRPPRPGGLSRHFRRHSDDAPPAPAPAPAKEAAAPPPGEEDDDLEMLTDQLRSLVARKKARERAEAEPAAPPAAEAPRGGAGSRRMARSGNVNVAVMLGQPVDEAAPPTAKAAPVSAPASAEPSGGVEVAPVPPAASTEVSPGEAPAPAAPPPPAVVPFRPAFSEMPPPRRGGMGWLVGIAALALGGIGFWLGQLSVPAPPPPRPAAAAPSAPEVWRDKTVVDLDAAMKADRAGDLPTALRLARALRDANPGLPGIKLYAADLAIRADDGAQAEADLALMVDAREDIAQAFYLRAFNFGRQRRFPDCFRALQASLVIDPFNVDGLYQVGELLRRQGQFKDAVELFEQAKLRARPGHGLAMETIDLKLRLALLEVGRGAEVEAALAEARKTPPLSAEWQFTQAALAIQKSDWPVAISALRRAREMMSRESFQWLVDDYFFRNAATTQGAMGEFRVPEEERARRRATSWEFFIDP